MNIRITLWILFIATVGQSWSQIPDRPGSSSGSNRISLPSRIEGLNLSLLSLPATTNSGNKPPVLFLHGASFPSSLAAGFQMNENSWMNELSENGFDVFALDFLGYGDSDLYPEMNSKESSTIPLGTAKEVSNDVEIAAEYILELTNFDKLYIIGHSWGGAVAGYYSSIHPENIEKLVLFAPVAHRQGATNWDTPDYPFIDKTAQSRIDQFLSNIPDGEEVTLEDEILSKWGTAWLESDKGAALRNSNSVRYPSGWKKDLFDCWNGSCILNPTNITVSTLVIRGEWDTTFSSTDAEILFQQLTNAPLKRYVVLEKSTHVAHLEKRRDQLYREVNLFLCEDSK